MDQRGLRLAEEKTERPVGRLSLAVTPLYLKSPI